MNAKQYHDTLAELRELCAMLVDMKKDNPDLSERIIGFKLGYEFATKFRKDS